MVRRLCSLGGWSRPVFETRRRPCLMFVVGFGSSSSAVGPKKVKSEEGG